jgi:hypothetical protein
MLKVSKIFITPGLRKSSLEVSKISKASELYKLYTVSEILKISKM